MIFPATFNIGSQKCGSTLESAQKNAEIKKISKNLIFVRNYLRF
jgi:hypothetical protein